jgi:hypothetical protein
MVTSDIKNARALSAIVKPARVRKSQRNLGREPQRRMAAREHQPQPVIRQPR